VDHEEWLKSKQEDYTIQTKTAETK